MLWLAYLHPALMLGVLALGLLVLREGLRLRQARFQRRPRDSQRHRNLARVFVPLIVLGFGSGLLSLGVLRGLPVFESVHSVLVTGALVGLSSAGLLGVWVQRSGHPRVRSLHALLGALGLLLALTAVVAAFAILP